MRWGAFAVDVSADGLTVDLRRGDDRWATFRFDGAVARGCFIDDADEVEHTFRLGELGLASRHSVADGWTMRWAVAAGESAPSGATPRLRMQVLAASGMSAWAWAAGAEGCLMIAPAVGPGPVVGIRLLHGWFESTTDGFFLTPELRASPGGRFVTSLRADLQPDSAGLAQRLPAWFVPLELPAGQPWEFDSLDHGLVVSPPATSGSEDDREVVYAPPGRATVAVHSARGVTRLTLSVAASMDSVLAAAASSVLDAMAEPTPTTAYLVLEALNRSLVPAPAAARLWLDRFRWTRADDLLAVAFGVRQAQASGDGAAIETALQRLAALPVNLGYARVVMATWLASLGVGLAVHDRAVELLSRGADQPLAALELSVLGLRSAEVAGPVFAGIVNALGGPLPGEPIGRDLVEQAHLAGVLELLPEEWPMAADAAACAVKSRRRLLAIIIDEQTDESLAALAWLAVSDALS